MKRLLGLVVALAFCFPAFSQVRDSLSITAPLSSADAIDFIRPEFQPLSRMLSISRAQIPTLGNSLEIMSGMRKLELVTQDIAGAQESIHFNYYHFSRDEDPALVRQLLMGRAGEGLDVRFLAENVANPDVPLSYFTGMRKSGVQVRLFTPFVRPVRFFLRLNNRNHQKIAVIDSKVGYIGGMNMSKLYFREWRDTDMRIEGPAATVGLDGVFWKAWEGSGLEPCVHFADTVSYPEVDKVGKIVQIVSDGPFDGSRTMEDSYQWVLDNTSSYFYAVTPYFVPPKHLMKAMWQAAERGADVRIMIPGVSDVPVMDPLNRFYMRRCLRGGVRVFMSRGAFNHSKTFVTDDYLTSIGSVNYDYRSFRLNYEDNAFIYDAPVADFMRDRYLSDCDTVCDELKPSDVFEWPLSQKVIQGLLWLLSPLM